MCLSAANNHIGEQRPNSPRPAAMALLEGRTVVGYPFAERLSGKLYGKRQGPDLTADEF